MNAEEIKKLTHGLSLRAVGSLKIGKNIMKAGNYVNGQTVQKN